MKIVEECFLSIFTLGNTLPPMDKTINVCLGKTGEEWDTMTEKERQDFLTKFIDENIQYRITSKLLRITNAGRQKAAVSSNLRCKSKECPDVSRRKSSGDDQTGV